MSKSKSSAKPKLKVEKPKSIDLYLSYHLKSTEIVKSLYNKLYFDYNYDIFMNAVQSNKSNSEQLSKHLNDSKCILCFITKKYSESVNCKNEILYAREHKIPILVLMLEKLTTKDLAEVGTVISPLTRLYFYEKVLKETDFTQIWQGDSFDSLIKAVKKIIPIDNKKSLQKTLKDKDRSLQAYDDFNNTTITAEPIIDLYNGKEKYPNGDRYEGELSRLLKRDFQVIKNVNLFSINFRR